MKLDVPVSYLFRLTCIWTHRNLKKKISINSYMNSQQLWKKKRFRWTHIWTHSNIVKKKDLDKLIYKLTPTLNKKKSYCWTKKKVLPEGARDCCALPGNDTPRSLLDIHSHWQFAPQNRIIEHMLTAKSKKD